MNCNNDGGVLYQCIHDFICLFYWLYSIIVGWMLDVYNQKAIMLNFINFVYKVCYYCDMLLFLIIVKYTIKIQYDLDLFLI